MKYYILRYRDALRVRGVKFDYSEVDKSLFQALTAEMGSEKAFVQQVEPNDENSVVLSKEAKFHHYLPLVVKKLYLEVT